MKTFLQHAEPIALTLLRVFLGATVALYVNGQHDLKALGAAGLGAVAVAVANWLNPQDTRYGVGASDGAGSA